MRRLLLFSMGWLLCLSFLHAQQTLQERLGYSPQTKLLIIHADDLGVSHAENAATIRSMEQGCIRSASILVPCPWFPEIAAYAVAHPRADFGLHLALTSEWTYYKWGPVAAAGKVPGLVNREGYFYASTDSVFRSATVSEVETEVRGQIEKAKQFGVDITHLDTHMGVMYGNIDYLKTMIRLGREYRIPVMLMRPAAASPFNDTLRAFLTGYEAMADAIYSASPADFREGMEKYYTKVLQSVQPGLSIIIIHAAYDNDEMQAITTGHPDWGASWRQADYDFFTGETCKALLQTHNIRVITWREIRDKLYR